MKKILYLLSMCAVFAIKPIYGSPLPITHSHDGRSHTHVVPSNNHSHNGGSAKKQYNNNFSNMELSGIKALLEEDILFAFDKSKVNPSYNQILSTIAKYMIDESDYIATVRAYTDSVGKVNYNKKLSQKRANSVKFELVKYNVKATRIEAIGYGESNKSSNATSHGRAENRRAEIELQKGNIKKIYPLVKKDINLTRPSREENSYVYSAEKTPRTFVGSSDQKKCSYSEIEQYSYMSCAAKIGGCSIASSLLIGQSPKAVKYVSGKGCDALLGQIGFSSTHKVGEGEEFAKVVAELSSWASILLPDSEWAKNVDPKIQFGAKVPSYFNCVEHSLKQNVCF